MWQRHFWYDRQGRPISATEAERLLGDIDARRVAHDVFVIDDAPVWVSTAHVVLDHGFEPDAPPLIFETMIFGGPDADYCARYATEADALAGHVRIVERYAAGAPAVDD